MLQTRISNHIFLSSAFFFFSSSIHLMREEESLVHVFLCTHKAKKKKRERNTVITRRSLLYTRVEATNILLIVFHLFLSFTLTYIHSNRNEYIKTKVYFAPISMMIMFFFFLLHVY
jgi:hypothetical protein